jgi:hypothetical protein
VEASFSSTPDLRRPDPVRSDAGFDHDHAAWRAEAVRSHAAWVTARARELVSQARLLRSANAEQRLAAIEQLARLRDGSPLRAMPARPDGGDPRPAPSHATGSPGSEPSPARVISIDSPRSRRI